MSKARDRNSLFALCSARATIRFVAAYPTLPRDLIKRAENENFPLIGLAALKELRKAFDELESAAILRAREMGASSTDIGEALGLTRQAAYYRIRQLLERRETGRHDEVVVLPETQQADPRT
jgi:hypothetical protein